MFKILSTVPSFISKSTLINNLEYYNKRALWGYVAIAFNQVDAERLKQVGPDRLCAEWVLKNGGGVRFLEIPNRLVKDYNSLPPEGTKLHIKVVDASNASVMKIGLEHFKNCRFIESVILHNCKHLEEDGLQGLLHLKETLKVLQISGCYNIADKDLKVIGELKNLLHLLMFDMKYVKNMNAVIEELKKQLPNCNFETKNLKTMGQI